MNAWDALQRAAIVLGAALSLAATPTPVAVDADSRYRVVLLEPPNADAIGTEVISRVHGELLAAGFEVVVLPQSSAADAQTAVEAEARDLRPLAVLALRQGAEAATGNPFAELWISDRLFSETLVQRTRVNPDKPSRDIAQLAVHVVELLKARTAELSVRNERKQTAPEPPPPMAEPPPPPPKPPERSYPGRVTLSAGLGVLDNLSALPPLFTPVFRGGFVLPEIGAPALRLETRASLAAFGPKVEIRSNFGTADVHQTFGNLDVIARFGAEQTLQPFLSLGGGLYVVDVEGDAPEEYDPRSEQTLTPLGILGAGVRAELWSFLTWSAEAQLLAITSKTVVRVNRQETWENRAPLFFLSTALGATF